MAKTESAAPVVEAPKYPKKITTSSIGLDSPVINALSKDGKIDKDTPIMRVYGRISGTETGQSQFGPWTKYKGEHEAINLLDNSRHRSRTLMVPDVATQILDGLLAARKDESVIVEYAIDILAKKYANPNKDGLQFTFNVQSLLNESTGEDAISMLGKKLAAPKLLGA